MDFLQDFEKSPTKILTENLSENVSTISFHTGRATPSKSQLKIFLKILTEKHAVFFDYGCALISILFFLLCQQVL